MSIKHESLRKAIKNFDLCEIQPLLFLRARMKENGVNDRDTISYTEAVFSLLAGSYIDSIEKLVSLNSASLRGISGISIEMADDIIWVVSNFDRHQEAINIYLPALFAGKKAEKKRRAGHPKYHRGTKNVSI